MKKIKYIAFAVTVLTLASCGDDFLDQKNLYDKSDALYYKSESDVSEALAGAYSNLPSSGGANDIILMSELMSDECFGGGGSGDITFHDLDAFTNNVENNYSGLWTEYYKGINRVNMLLKRFDQVKFSSEVNKNQAHGEAYFLRAFFYFNLAKFFGNVPLLTAPEPLNLPKASADEIYGQIASDMKKAIELMPSITWDKWPEAMIGHSTKWAAEGMMARIFLFYTGYYNKTSLPLAEGGEITKEQAIAWVDDCIDNSKHGLASDFRNIWAYSAVDPEQYPFNKKNSLVWIGEGKPNNETMFALKYSVYGGWTSPSKVQYCNQLALFMGLRIQTSLVPWSLGWGAGSVNPQFFTSFEPGDVRAKGSVIDITDPDELGNGTYQWGSNQMIQETGLWNKKNTSLQQKVGNSIQGIFVEAYKAPSDGQLWNIQDEILLRFADVLLMGSELKLGTAKGAEYFNKVRTRAGLTAIASPTLDDIKKERKYELAFEGIRYHDLLRWHEAKQAIEKANGVTIQNLGVETTYDVTFREETGGFLPIPETEIRISAGVLTQNPGW